MEAEEARRDAGMERERGGRIVYIYVCVCVCFSVLRTLGKTCTYTRTPPRKKERKKRIPTLDSK